MHVTCPCGHWTASKQNRVLGRHRNQGLELVWVANGAVTWDYDGQPVHVSAGHLSFTWPWQWHGAMNDQVGSAELSWIILPFRKTPSAPTRHLELHPALGLTRDENRHLVRRLVELDAPTLKIGRLASQLFARSVEVLAEDRNELTLRSRSLLLALLSELMDRMEEAPPSVAPDARSRVQQGLKILEARCGETWTLDRMAETCGMGRTHFTRWVKELTGDTPIQYLNRKRIEQAQRLLQDGRQTVTDVAMACGFQSSQYFATVHRLFTGHPPSAGRREAKARPEADFR